MEPFMTQPDPTPASVERARREAAIQIVDGVLGYTMEYAGSPAAHRQYYDLTEEAMQPALDAARQAGAREARTEQEHALQRLEGLREAGTRMREAFLRHVYGNGASMEPPKYPSLIKVVEAWDAALATGEHP